MSFSGVDISQCFKGQRSGVFCHHYSQIWKITSTLTWKIYLPWLRSGEWLTMLWFHNFLFLLRPTTFFGFYPISWHIFSFSALSISRIYMFLYYVFPVSHFLPKVYRRNSNPSNGHIRNLCCNPQREVVLLKSTPRILGFAFNPIRVYVCVLANLLLIGVVKSSERWLNLNVFKGLHWWYQCLSAINRWETR